MPLFTQKAVSLPVFEQGTSLFTAEKTGTPALLLQILEIVAFFPPETLLLVGL